MRRILHPSCTFFENHFQFNFASMPFLKRLNGEDVKPESALFVPKKILTLVRQHQPQHRPNNDIGGSRDPCRKRRESSKRWRSRVSGRALPRLLPIPASGDKTHRWTRIHIPPSALSFTVWMAPKLLITNVWRREWDSIRRLSQDPFASETCQKRSFTGIFVVSHL
jgi:hypothetical protein